jgi:hypothetical protein
VVQIQMRCTTAGCIGHLAFETLGRRRHHRVEATCEQCHHHFSMQHGEVIDMGPRDLA